MHWYYHICTNKLRRYLNFKIPESHESSGLKRYSVVRATSARRSQKIVDPNRKSYICHEEEKELCLIKVPKRQLMYLLKTHIAKEAFLVLLFSNYKVQSETQVAPIVIATGGILPHGRCSKCCKWYFDLCQIIPKWHSAK